MVYYTYKGLYVYDGIIVDVVCCLPVFAVVNIVRSGIHGLPVATWLKLAMVYASFALCITESTTEYL